MKRFSEYFCDKEKSRIARIADIQGGEFDDFGVAIRRNIASALGCQMEESDGFVILPGGYTNLSMRFSLKQDMYVYRHPGNNTGFIDRKCEAHSNRIGNRLGLDKSFIHLDSEHGWKLSRYISGARILDYHNQKDMSEALRIMRTLHCSGEKTTRDFHLWDEAITLYESIFQFGQKNFPDFEYLFNQMANLEFLAKSDNIPCVLTHGDTWQHNYLITDDPETGYSISIIDWEASGNNDPGFDLGTYICCSDYTFDQAVDVINKYYNHSASEKEFRHMIAWTAISSYYWFIYGVYMLNNGTDINKFVELWRGNAVAFLKKAQPYY